jgi:hypothetical protein
MNGNVLLAWLVALLVSAPAAHAGDTLTMGATDGARARSAGGLPRPSRGMKMDEVLQRFGEPRQRLPAVGEPPISRWIYFENEYTITSVLHRQDRRQTP